MSRLRRRFHSVLWKVKVEDEVAQETDFHVEMRARELVAKGESPEDARALYMGANGLVALGERKRGLEWVERALTLDPDEPMVLYNVACIQCLAGDDEAALSSLERALEAGMTAREWLEHDSNLDPIRDTPRFQALFERKAR